MSRHEWFAAQADTLGGFRVLSTFSIGEWLSAGPWRLRRHDSASPQRDAAMASSVLVESRVQLLGMDLRLLYSPAHTVSPPARWLGAGAGGESRGRCPV